MGVFGLFGKKVPSSVTAHILDPNSGYTQQTWVVGQQIQRDAVEKFSDNGNLFVVVAYKAGVPSRMICRRDVWNQTKAQFDQIDAEGKDSLRRAMDLINKPE